MYKNLIYLIAVACVLASCGQRKTKEPAADSTGIVFADVPATSEEPIDTVELANKTFLVYTIDSAVFEKFKAQPIDTSEALALSRDTSVKRMGSSLQFRLDNGKTLTLTDNDSENDTTENAFAHYLYVSNFPAIHRKGVIVYYYESQDYLLVDTRNGDTLHIWAEPIFSPDKKHLLCASMDLVAAFMPNGFQWYDIDKDSIVYKGEANLEKWGPTETKWVDPKTILCQYITIDEEGNTQSSYVKMVMQ